MNCPTCSASVEATQQFCRACGASLTEDAGPKVHPRTVVLVAVLAMFFGIIVGVTGGMLELRWLKFTGVYITLIGMLTLVGGNLILQRIAETRNKWRIADANVERRRSLDRADTTNKLPPINVNDFPPSSVVENSTEFLKEPRRNH